MKFKSVPLLAVMIASTAMTLAACQSQSSSTQETPGAPAQTQNAQTPDASTSPDSGSSGSMRGGGLPPGLKLTDEQKTKLQGIQENYRSKMQSILTEEQKSQLKASRGQGKGQAGMQSLNLTDAQKQQLKDLRQAQRQEIDSVLTPEQKQQLQKMRQDRQGRPNREAGSAPQGQ